MSLTLLFLYLMLNMFRMLMHPSSGDCDLCAELFHGLHRSVKIRIYSGNIIKIYYTLRTLCNHKTPQQPIFAETHFLKQPHTSRLNTLYKISALMQKSLSLQINATHEITQRISRKLLRMDVLTSETC